MIHWDIQFKKSLDLVTDYFPNDFTDSNNVLLIDCQKYKAIIVFPNNVELTWTVCSLAVTKMIIIMFIFITYSAMMSEK